MRVGRKRRLRQRDARLFAGHARRLAEQHRQRQVDGPGGAEAAPSLVIRTSSGRRRWPDRRRRTGSARARRSPRTRPADRGRSPARSAPAPRCTTARAATARARRWGWRAARRRAPRSLSLTSSGSAFDRPPAPTSWIERIGLSAPSAMQRSITSWQRRCISGLSRCTDAKSRSSCDAPDAIDDAAPPPRPISIAGPPSTISGAPAGISPLVACSGGRCRSRPRA